MAVEQYRIESDSVQMFLSEYGYNVSATQVMPLKNMFADYRSYCNENFFKTCSVRTFSERLRSSGYQIVRKNYGMEVNSEKECF